MLLCMAGSAGSLAAAVSGADSELTVLDDRLDAEEHATFMWLRAHQLRGYPHHRVVIGTDQLPAAWVDRKKKFTNAHSVELYLRHFLHNHAAMHSLQTVARSLDAALPAQATDAQVIASMAASVFNGRAWVLELPTHDLKSRFIAKTSPAAFAPLNPRYGTKVDFAFIAAREGDQWLRGYIPMSKGKVLGKSGMTVASGFDIGQWSTDELDKLKFPDALMAKIKMFASPNRFKGMTRAEVVKKVGQLGPVPELTKDEADLCDGAVFSKILGDAITAWNSSTDFGVPKFTALPGGWQTVWLSRVYQEGSNPRSVEAIRFRNTATAGDWQGAITKLRAYTGFTKTRANQEADLLAKELPPPMAPPKQAPK